MIKEENDCCGCATESYPCLGDTCSFRHAKHYYCDKCKNEFSSDELYVSNDDGYEKQLCAECLLLKFPTVEQIERGDI